MTLRIRVARLRPQSDLARKTRPVLGAFALMIGLSASSLAAPPVVGVLALDTKEVLALWLPLFREGLQALGHKEGQTFALEVRTSQGDNSRFPSLARDLLQRKPAVILGPCGPALRAIRDLDRLVPFVALCADWNNYLGEVKSLTRPGGATTGFYFMGPESAGKRLELLKEMHPRLSRVAVLHNRIDNWDNYWREMKRAASSLGVALLPLPAIERAEDVEASLLHAVRGEAEALVAFPDATTLGAARQIAAFAIQHRLLSALEFAFFAEFGGLLSYGPDFRELIQGAAPPYIDKILKGASPAELPVQQPTKFRMIVNLKTAKTLGLRVPQSMLLRADRVIE